MGVVPFPQRPALARPDLARLVPSGRSLLVAFALTGCGALLYIGARETSVFAIRTVTVRGPDGSEETVAVSNPNILGRVKVGEELVVTESQKVAISLAQE